MAVTEARREYQRQYREVNRDRLNEKDRQYHAANADRMREQQRQYREANADRRHEQQRQYREANREQINERKRQQYYAAARERGQQRLADIRSAVLDHYGRACACCDSTDRLEVDHIAGDGRQHRAELGVSSGSQFYRWLVVNGFPDGFQTLCVPCNRSKSNGPQCRLDHAKAA
jgi:hypothetical protein